MTFKVTYQPRNRIFGVNAETVEYDAADEAWRAVDGLMHSDEKVKVTKNGRHISWQELRDLAKRSDYSDE